MSVRFYSTDSTTEPIVSMPGTLIHKFAMVGEGDGEKRVVSLDFLIYLPASEALRAWEWEYIHKEFFLEAVKAQGSLNLSDEAEDEEEERVNPLVTEIGRSQKVVAAKPGKSGPKELADYHSKQKPN